MAVAADLVPVAHRSSTVAVFGWSVVGLIVRRDVDVVRDLVRHRVDFDQRYGGPIGGMSHAVLRIHHSMQRRHREKSGAQKDAEGTNRILQTGSLTRTYPRCDAHATEEFGTDRRDGGRPLRRSPGHFERQLPLNPLPIGLETMAGGKKTTIRGGSPRWTTRPYSKHRVRRRKAPEPPRPGLDLVVALISVPIAVVGALFLGSTMVGTFKLPLYLGYSGTLVPLAAAHILITPRGWPRVVATIGMAVALVVGLALLYPGGP